MNEPDGALVVRLTREVADRLSERLATDGSRLPVDDERSYAAKLINDGLDADARRRMRDGHEPLRTAVEQDVARAVLDRLFGLGRLQRFLDDDEVSDVAVNGCDRVFVTFRDGRRERGAPVADSDDELVELIRLAAARMGRTERRFDAAEPELNMQLPDGSRLHAVRDVSGRPCVSIRRHRFTWSFLDDLVGLGMLSPQLSDFLAAAVRARRNIVISGATGAGNPTRSLWHTKAHGVKSTPRCQVPAHLRRPRGTGARHRPPGPRPRPARRTAGRRGGW